MTLEENAPVVIVSRVGYDMLLRDGELIGPLRNRPLIFIHSVRTSHLPPRNAYVELHLIELRDCDDYLTALLRSIMLRHAVAQVITLSEQDLAPVVFARNALGFQGIAIEQAVLFRDKIAMKARLAGSGIALPADAEGSDDARVRELFSAHGKLVVKPRDGYGSQDTSLLETDADVEQFLGTPSLRRNAYLVEQFVTGEVFHLDAVVRSGEILFSSLGKYEVPPMDFTGRRWVGTRFTNVPCAVHDAAQRHLLSVLETFDTSDGVFHFEFFFDGVAFTFGEIAIRPVGGGVADAIYDSFGVHLVEEHVRIQLGLPTNIAQRTYAAAYGASLLLLSEAPGVVKEYEGLEDVGHRTLNRVNYHYVAGDRVSSTRYSADSLLTCSLTAVDPGHLDSDITKIKAQGRVVLAD